MILCSDYNPDECPIECLYASNTERYMTEPFDEFFTKSKLYGSDVCPLKKKPEPLYVSNEDVKSIEMNDIKCSFEGPDPLDKLTDELKKAQDDAITKILNAYGLNAECVKQHPEKFTLQEMTMPGLTGRITSYKLSYNDKAIGEWKIHTSIDFDKNFVKSELSYRIL